MCKLLEKSQNEVFLGDVELDFAFLSVFSLHKCDQARNISGRHIDHTRLLLRIFEFFLFSIGFLSFSTVTAQKSQICLLPQSGKSSFRVENMFTVGNVLIFRSPWRHQDCLRSLGACVDVDLFDCCALQACEAR